MSDCIHVRRKGELDVGVLMSSCSALPLKPHTASLPFTGGRHEASGVVPDSTVHQPDALPLFIPYLKAIYRTILLINVG